MKIYHYHPETGELLGEGVAQPDPLEHARLVAEHRQARLEAGEDLAQDEEVEPQHWLVPANATAIAPLKPRPGYTQVFADGRWSRVKLPEAPELKVEPPTWDELRRRAYGPLVAQLEMIYRQLRAIDPTGEYVAHIDAVKAAHPKPADPAAGA